MKSFIITLLLACLWTCEFWPTQTVQYEIAPSLLRCPVDSANLLQASWSPACHTALAEDSIALTHSMRTQGFPWPTRWPLPAQACTVQVVLAQQKIPCQQISFFWTPSSGITYNIAKFSWRNDTLTTCRMIQGDITLQHWWQNPFRIDSISIASLFAQAMLEQNLSVDTVTHLEAAGIIPWNLNQRTELAHKVLLAKSVSRELYLAWSTRSENHLWVDSLLREYPRATELNYQRIGSCPATQNVSSTTPIQISAKPISAADCGVQESGLTWDEASLCAQRFGKRMATLAEIRCLRGLWLDSLPSRWISDLSEWSADTTIDGYGILVESDSLNAFLPVELRKSARPLGATFHLVTPDSTPALCPEFLEKKMAKSLRITHF